jgi:uncharacterized RDD family membrane protein YckC
MSNLSAPYPANIYQNGSRRFLAAILDAIIVSVPLIVITLNAVRVGNFVVIQWAAVLFPFLQIFYSVYNHYKSGQTWAKSLLNIQVVDVSENRKLTLKQAMYRDSVWIFFAVAGLLVFIIQENDPNADNAVFRTIDYISDNFASTWFLLEILTMFTNKKRRAFHDYLAGSVVVRVGGNTN